MAEGLQRTILHMDLDSFFVSVEVLKNPLLKGKPVIVGGTAERGIVASCSYEARKFGIHSAMSTMTAKKLCPHAIFLHGSYQDYSDYSEKVTDIISERVPVMEKSSIDEFYIDLTGMDTFFGSFKLAKEIREIIKTEIGLPISFGLASNKTVAKIATGEAKPDGFLKIDYGKEKEFLAKLHVTKIPGVGDKTFPKLKEMGIEMVKELQETDIILMEEKFGEYGILLWNRANGIDNNPVIPYSDRKSISSENTFENDVTDKEYLETFIISLVEQLAFKLRKENFITSCIAIKIRYSNFETHTQQMAITYTSSDNIIIPKIKELYNKLHTSGRPVRLIGVRLSNLRHGDQQIDLFDDTAENLSLYKALDKINKKFGNKTVHRAKTIDVGQRSFNPFNGRRID